MQIQIKMTSSENANYYGVPKDSIVEEDFETYVAAVVASEIGNAPLEACKAQAVVSRTFAYRYLLKNKVISDSSSSAQAYRAVRYSDSYSRCIIAAKETRGVILTYKGSPADTYFCHSNGGYTVSSEERWGGARAYLVSKPDSWTSLTKVNKSGHGVGMSQVGAKYAAEHGVMYQDILAFYYPGTERSRIAEKEEQNTMITLAQFLEGCEQNAARIKKYVWGKSGKNGESDCIGYIIGAQELMGQKWGGTHGSNYAKRYRLKNGHTVSNASQLKLGELVFKIRKPGDAKYDLPDKYKSSGDLNDYYHVGVVTSVNPLTISHCSTGGMNYDHKLGKWCYAGDCSLVDYSGRDSTQSFTPTPVPTTPTTPQTGKMVVDVPDDTSVNVRAKASTGSNILTRLPEGTEVEVSSTFGGWSHVNYTYQKTGSGYVMSKFLKDGVVDVPDDTSVNVRRRPSTGAEKITTIPEGTKVTINDTSGSWSKVTYSFPQNGTGYVMSKYLKKG